jgi:flavin-dependent dehydrogenase
MEDFSLMKVSDRRKRMPLEPNAAVAVLGGGPAGAFFAIHLLRRAQALGRDLRVIIIERRWPSKSPLAESPQAGWNGCNYCAGGISPKLNDVLKSLNLKLPEDVIQSRIHSINIQGYWKNIELEIPSGREMLSIYRGVWPSQRTDGHRNFDSFLLQEAVKAGAELISAEVDDIRFSEGGKPLIRYSAGGVEATLEADLAVFATGVNEEAGFRQTSGAVMQTLPRLIPGFAPPRVRHALIFELETPPGISSGLEDAVHFVEYGSKKLRLEMCSLVPKRGFVTVVLLGSSIDALTGPREIQDIIRRFLDLPHIRKLIPSQTRQTTSCVCRPNMVIGSAKRPFSERIAAIGDLVTSRLYKDGILSAHRTGKALAETVLTVGIDSRSLRQGYGPTLRHFRRDNRFAAVVFFLHRVFFSSSLLSRVLYQAVITERKMNFAPDRHLEKILWNIASGDDRYEDIFFSMIRPATLRSILTGGAFVTLRNYIAELIFGLRWKGFGRFTTGVAKERMQAKRLAFSQDIAKFDISVPAHWEFERMYAIKIRAPRARIMDQLGRFGDKDRGFFRPRWIHIHRSLGIPNAPGCEIRYELPFRFLSFKLVLERIADESLAVYEVRDGFARGGVLIFEIEKSGKEIYTLSIYVAFNFTRGRTRITRPFWALFRTLFPAFVHDVLWNHSLCQFKDIVETERSGAS